jgi:DNA gyrase subunit A
LNDDVVRVFAGRDSSGVRGIKLQSRDEVMSLSVLRHIDASPAEREAYIKLANARRRNGAEDERRNGAEEERRNGAEDERRNGAEDELPDAPTDAEEIEGEANLTQERIAAMEEAEEMLLTVTDSGFGKRSSAYEYRVTGRGGQGIANITLAPRRNGKSVVATFPVREGDDVMLVTDAGRLIRVPADQVRITGRQAMGVTLFRVDAGEHVTSVFPVLEEESDEGDTPLDPPLDPTGDNGDTPGDDPGGDPSDGTGIEDGNDA